MHQLTAATVTPIPLKQAKSEPHATLLAFGERFLCLRTESRNILQRLQMTMDELSMVVDCNSDQAALVAKAIACLREQIALFRDTQEIAGPMLLDRRRANVRDIWRSAWEDIGYLRHQYTPSLAESCLGDTICSVDGGRLKQVFRNFLENSIAAFPDAIITISTDIVCGRHSQFLEVHIRDNGPGMSDAEMKHVFEHFYTTKRHGTGLGLAICRRIIEAHDGEIVAAKNDPGAFRHQDSPVKAATRLESGSIPPRRINA